VNNIAKSLRGSAAGVARRLCWRWWRRRRRRCSSGPFDDRRADDGGENPPDRPFTWPRLVDYCNVKTFIIIIIAPRTPMTRSDRMYPRVLAESCLQFTYNIYICMWCRALMTADEVGKRVGKYNSEDAERAHYSPIRFASWYRRAHYRRTTAAADPAVDPADGFRSGTPLGSLMPRTLVAAADEGRTTANGMLISSFPIVSE